jgi:hypothetical protein
MSKVNRLGMYADVRQVLDSALAHGGGRFQCASHGDAVHWRQRAYKFRKAYAEVLGPKAMSQYDALVLPRLAPDSATVVIEVRQSVGVFTPAGPPVGPPMDDDLLDVVAAISRKLNGD